jgi:hypothetical protein
MKVSSTSFDRGGDSGATFNVGKLEKSAKKD